MNYLDDFLLHEYDNISKAHFNISQRITNFFQYIITIYSAPLVLISYYLKDNQNIPHNIGFILIGIGGIGFFLMMYMTSLRFEALLYARQVNAIRNKIIKVSKIKNFHDIISLPVSKKQPSYIDSNFQWIIYIFSVVNTTYIISGLYQIDIHEVVGLYRTMNEIVINIINITNMSFDKYIDYIIISIIIVIFHVMMYRYYAFRQEHNLHMYKRRIGVDIDGVMNLHRDRFCEVYNKLIDDKKLQDDKGLLINRKIGKDELISYPVRDAGIGITNENEKLIFSYYDYWNDMPVNENAFNILSRIYHKHHYNVWFVTYKDSKIKKSFTLDQNQIKKKKIMKMTKSWLKKNSKDCKFSYKTHFESSYLLFLNDWGFLDKWGRFLSLHQYTSRASYCRKKKFQYFVEDSPWNARKLADICEWVFLIRHPYNESIEMPANVIRVDRWKEIEAFIDHSYSNKL